MRYFRYAEGNDRRRETQKADNPNVPANSTIIAQPACFIASNAYVDVGNY